jgi:hypothetical protein
MFSQNRESLTDKEMCPKSSIMLIEKRKHIQTDLAAVLTKNNIPINIDLIEELTEKILGINPQKI